MNSKKAIAIIILFLITISFILTPINTNTNGLETACEIIISAFKPSVSELPQALNASITTVFYASAGMSIALFFSFFLSLYASGILTESKRIQNMIRNFFAGSRAIHELIWALFFVTAFGLMPMTALLALAVPYTGMLGKVFTDIFCHMDLKKIRRLEGLGASKAQMIFYGYLPQALPQLISYSLYRFECALRSSTILSFVGITGLGMKIQLMLNDLRFNEMFTYIYVLFLLVVIIEIWGNLYRQKKFRNGTIIVSIILFISSWYFILIPEGALYDTLISQKNLSYMVDFISKLLGFQSETIAFLDIKEISYVFVLTLKTLQMSFVAIALSILFMSITVILATKRYSHPLIYGLVRSIYLFTRAIPELIWAMILIFIFKPGIWVGALALAIHNFGILSKLCAEVIENMNEKPLLSLRQAGAKKGQLLMYGVLPSVIKSFISYSIYRWEIILRTTIIVGLVGAGGLGYYFRLNFSWFHYTNITLVLVFYLLLVKLADKMSLYLNKVWG